MTNAMAGLVVCGAAVAAAGVSTAAGGREPLCIGGIYPHLAVFNGTWDPEARTWRGTGRECGIGAVVPWAGRLWLITYPPHETRGGRDKLWTIDADLRLSFRPESVGGTHAARMIHRESNQLIIGPYFVDAEGNVRAADVGNALVGRMTAVMRHLTDPANKVYFYDMEGALYEVDVHSLAVRRLFAKPVPGWHGKGGYTAQGRVVIANNGERGRGGDTAYRHLQVGGPPKGPDEIGCLAEWDGRTWRIVERKQFLDVTGPGGIYGAPDANAPLWAIGWDRRSGILKLLDVGRWYTFRLPKASHCYDPAHGWYTEWPRIRQVGGGRWMMDLHGTFFDFPPTFRAGRTGGLRPIATHLRYVPDFCEWNGRLVIAADDASTMGNPLCRKAQSNLWFGRREDLPGWGPRSGWGGVWVDDAVAAGVPSVPFAVGGYDRVCLHLAVGGARGGGTGRRLRCSDRFPIDELPDVLAGLTSVAVPRGRYTDPAPAYHFTVDRPVVVYLAMDARGRPDPGAGWERTALAVRWGGGYRDVVYRRAFPAGRVDIPGRADAHKAGAYPLPNLCFLAPAGEAGPAVNVSNLPGQPGAVVSPPPARPERQAKAGPAKFTVQVDRDGTGRWAALREVTVGPDGYAWSVFEDGIDGCWVRLVPAQAGVATAYFHCNSLRPSRPGEREVFAALAPAGGKGGVCGGLICPAEHNTRLQFVARRSDAAGAAAQAGYWEVDEKMAFHAPRPGRAPEVRDLAAVRKDFDVDAASAVMTWKGRRYRLPKGPPTLEGPLAVGRARGIREVQSERYLVNVCGTFYEMPRDTGVPHIKPVCTHNRQIVDFCSWRGLLVLSGTRAGARPDGRYFASPDGRVGLWFGHVDDLWALGKPVGRGGPWHEAAVRAGEPSDAYLMTGYDRKTLELAHDAPGAVTFTVEVDFLATGRWYRYGTVTVPAGRTERHEFPRGFGAYWARLKADRNCRATATFIYR